MRLSDSESEELTPIDTGLARDRLLAFKLASMALVANFLWWKMSKY